MILPASLLKIRKKEKQRITKKNQKSRRNSYNEESLKIIEIKKNQEKQRKSKKKTKKNQKKIEKKPKKKPRKTKEN